MIDLKCYIQEASDKSGLIIRDTTGDYDVDLNPTGWGSPNPTTTDAYKVYLIAIDPYGITHQLELDKAVWAVDAFDQTFGYEVLASALLGQSTFDDGYYQFTYRVGFVTDPVKPPPDTYIWKSNTAPCGFIGDVIRKMRNISLNIDLELLSVVQQNDLLLANVLLSTLKNSEALNNKIYFNKILSRLTVILTHYDT